MTTEFYLGVDIGASKSHALVATQDGQAIGFARGGPGNYEVVGWAGLRETVQAITREALTSAGIGRDQLSGAGFGIAGYDWPAERAPTMQAIKSLGLRAPCGLVNDGIMCLLAGAPAGWGVAITAGTSNNCRGRDPQGREGRVTGCGAVFGEYGGAAELVAKAVQAVAMAWASRGHETDLTSVFVKRTGAVDATDLLEGLALGRYRISAMAAPDVFAAAAQGDAVAQELIEWAGRELGSLAIGVIRQLGFEDLDFDLVLAGSLFDGGPALAEALRGTVHRIARGARLIRLTAPPVVGSVLLGMEQTGLEITALRPALVSSLRELLESRPAP
jgi:N-acetylglucosamine kinase-like BadF-type ATPase